MWALDSKQLPAVDGFDIDVAVVEDLDSRPEHFDYNADVIEAWRHSDWQFAGVVVTASKNGHELGVSSVWGCERGWFPGMPRFIDPLVDNPYIDGLVDEAVQSAKAELAQLQEV
jgi:hypothetical protein